MKYTPPNRCPICDEELIISKLVCNHCHTTLEGNFTPCKFCKLPPEQLEFLEVFIKCRGSIKDVEKELNISYPTVRNRLDSVILSLGYRIENSDQSEDERKQLILSQLENGEISPKEAAKLLKKLK